MLLGDTHVFLSHVQLTGGDLADVLRLKLENRGLNVWIDHGYRAELNQQAMLDGVRRTHTNVLVLTMGIFASSAVLKELRCARDSEKHIVMVHEADTHRASYASFGEYVASTPGFCDGFFLEEESLPVRRKWYEEEAFYNELVRQCFEHWKISSTSIYFVHLFTETFATFQPNASF
ncbi:Hypothetical Protein FCC1311_043252 [Hondaea fermentalgiana]|uniref:TIR domain-containing protein n=1 Tax=Hondaea fermentalgiana TaxID=2315210 RepID=A0A2R5GAQ8_9STRA|nr:Hypothetical Protein FCC1311_043252 [Hondaea fermentalgiana]|eukprot:GBG28102.1 Hypothetical Protein FCC1311_043252 [Hondaea fermentalgiana]